MLDLSGHEWLSSCPLPKKNYVMRPYEFDDIRCYFSSSAIGLIESNCVLYIHCSVFFRPASAAVRPVR